MIPPRPERFGPEISPPGVEVKLISFWRDRPIIAPRLQLVHTNAAPKEGNVEAAYNWANQPGSGHTIPHIQFDRDGRAAMFLPSDRKGIANYRAADFSLGFETADTGTLTDPAISAFTPAQVDKIAVACAYYSVLHGIPLEYPAAWDSTGTACHTEPFGYPHWTNSEGKFCPGTKKKQQVRETILPLARTIVAAWTEPEPPPPPISSSEATMLAAIAKTTDGAHLAQFSFHGPIFTMGEHVDHDVSTAEVFGRGGGRAYNIVDQTVVSWSTTSAGSWGAVKASKTVAQVRSLMGE